MENPQQYLGRLKPIHVFKGLRDDEILDFAKELEFEQRAAGETIFEEGEEGQSFYIINRGQVKVLRWAGAAQKQVATLVPGDYFGETALLYGRRRSATCTAATDVELLRLSKEDFDNHLRKYPQIKPNLAVSVETRDIYRQQKWTWLAPDEVVYLIARRHKILLYQSLLLPGAAALVALVAVIGAGVFIAWKLALTLLVGAGLPITGWILWQVVDWGNDFYIVTNRRVIYLEKIVGIYDSRQEAPLGSILSVNVQTADTAQRALGMGDVIVRTFSGPITMKSVANPAAAAALVQEHWDRTKTREREAEGEAMKESVRRKLGYSAAPPKPAPPRPPLKPAGLSGMLGDYFSFRVRFDQGDTVIYRKHWYILLQDIWQPSLFVLLVAGVLGLRLAQVIPASVPLNVVVILSILIELPLLAWWWYEYEDWRNDIFQVTPDQIVDVTKKPFGQETRKSAPLANILSLKYERPGLLGYLMNFGSVVATVGGQEFRFDGVFDPVGVQNDIYRRMEAQKAKTGQAEAGKRRDEIADWLGVYHAVLNEPRPEPAPAPPAPKVEEPKPEEKKAS
jgi:CRP-like cAMP-binding protein